MAERNAAGPGAEPGHVFHPYDLGATVTSACQYDQRFSYSLYVPQHFSTANARDFRLLVGIHGTDRARHRLLDRFRGFADRHNHLVLVPLFPARIVDGRDMDNYKYLLYRDIRFDLILLHMIQEVIVRYQLVPAGLSMFGFSGGAHFAHRFLLLHPEQLHAVVVAAPGSVTRINDDSEWWVGTADTEALFGKPVDPAAIRKVRIHLVVGRDDTKTAGIMHVPGSSRWMSGANRAGGNRIERLQSLRDNLESHGIESDLAILDGVAHEEGPLIDRAAAFFEQVLA